MNTSPPFKKLFCLLKHQGFFFALTSILISTVACSKKRERRITVDTPRELTSLDKLSGRHVQITQKSATRSYHYIKPDTWIDQPATSFRKLNFTFGTKGEVYLSESRGGILPNVNRWLSQFGAHPLDSIDDLEQIPILSAKGYIVKSNGSFKGMQMTSAADNYQLLGVLVENSSNLITVKMTGPAAEVTAQEAAFKAFCSSLNLAPK